MPSCGMSNLYYYYMSAVLSLQLLNAPSTELYAGGLCDNIGLVLVYLPSGAMSLHHHLAIMT